MPYGKKPKKMHGAKPKMYGAKKKKPKMYGKKK